MVRRVGFNDSGRKTDSAARQVGEAGAQPGPPAGRPAVRRNWPRIVIQCFWVDLWLIAGYQAGAAAFRSLAAGDEMFSIYGLLFAIVLLGAIVSALRLLRLLRGEPVSVTGA